MLIVSNIYHNYWYTPVGKQQSDVGRWGSGSGGYIESVDALEMGYTYTVVYLRTPYRPKVSPYMYIRLTNTTALIQTVQILPHERAVTGPLHRWSRPVQS
jgi:hypothetical protein